MRGEGVAQRMRSGWLGDSSPLCCLSARLPDHLGVDWLIGAPVLYGSGKKVYVRPHPAPIFLQGFPQFRIEGNIPVARSFAVADVNHHLRTVDVADFEIADLGAAHAGCVKSHQDGAVKQITGGREQPGSLILCQDRGKTTGSLRVRNRVHWIWPPQ